MTSHHSTAPSRVDAWVEYLHENDTVPVRLLAENFQYYLQHVHEFADGELDRGDVPNFNPGTKTILHAAVIAGTSWGTMSDVYVVTTAVGDMYKAVFGIEENAVDSREQWDEDVVVQAVTPTGRDPYDDVAEMKAGDSDALPKVAACIEHVLDNADALEDGDTEGLFDTMPYFESDLQQGIVLSMVFGRLWEFSDPELWVVVDEYNGFHGVYADARVVAVATHDEEGWMTQAVTPMDNDRRCEITVEVPFRR